MGDGPAGIGAAMGVGGGAPHHRTISRRSSVVSTSSSFFDRSFFSTPESRIVDHGKKTTLAYATLMLNLYNDVSLDLRTAVDGARRIVVQTAATKGRASQPGPVLSRAHADADDAIDALRAIAATREFDAIGDLLGRSLLLYEDIADARAKSRE